MQVATKDRLSALAKHFDSKSYKDFHRTMSFNDYLNATYDEPKLIRSAYQRLYDMILSKGISTKERYRKTLNLYHFFDDVDCPIYGLEENLHQLVLAIRGAAGWYGPEKRVILLHGPVGSSKSTICRSLKRGLEKYSRSEEGTLYTFKWVNLPNGLYVKDEITDPMHEDPIKLLPLASPPSSRRTRRTRTPPN
jgi:serine protein kinase